MAKLRIEVMYEKGDKVYVHSRNHTGHRVPLNQVYVVDETNGNGTTLYLVGLDGQDWRNQSVDSREVYPSGPAPEDKINFFEGIKIPFLVKELEQTERAITMLKLDQSKLFMLLAKASTGEEVEKILLHYQLVNQEDVAKINQLKEKLENLTDQEQNRPQTAPTRPRVQTVGGQAEEINRMVGNWMLRPGRVFNEVPTEPDDLDDEGF